MISQRMFKSPLIWGPINESSQTLNLHEVASLRFWPRACIECVILFMVVSHGTVKAPSRPCTSHGKKYKLSSWNIEWTWVNKVWVIGSLLPMRRLLPLPLNLSSALYRVPTNLGHINFEPILNFYWKISMGPINCFLRKLMSVIVLFCATFILKLRFHVLVRSSNEDLEGDLETWTHVDATLTR
jgi:hypothetical protein